jgi:hypothetical protein
MWRTGFGSAAFFSLWRSTQRVACNILELFVLRAFQAFFISNVIEVPENWSRFCPSETN